MIKLQNYEQKIFSQNGEDGITIKLIESIYNDNHDNKFFVEFGVENGYECNTRILREKYNWNGLQMDGSNENIAINLRKEFILRNNIINLLNKYNVPKHINLLSIDIDSYDFYILHEIVKHFTCDVIICEYNSTHLPNEDKVIIYDYKMWDFTNYFGASLLALNNLCKKYDYTLVYCDNNGVNCFFIHNSIITEKNLQFTDSGNVQRLYKPPKYGPNRNGHPNDPHNRKYITSEQAFLI